MNTEPERQTKPCPICGETIAAVARKCRFCGEYLDPSARPRPVHSGMARLVLPVDVAPAAMVAGYLGLFSCVPFLGLPIGVGAIVLGVKGLRAVRESNGALVGRGRAMFGIVAGTLTTLFNAASLGVYVLGQIAGRS